MTASVWSCSPAFSLAIAVIEIDLSHLKGFTLDLSQFFGMGAVT